MYVFGGSSSFGLMNDLFLFDPKAIAWRLVDTISPESKSSPERRAGHSMVSVGENFYVFGGRGIAAGVLYGLNDVWRFNVVSRSWRLCVNIGTAEPVGRMHTAAAILQKKLFIYGGINPATNVVYKDLWWFDLQTFSWGELNGNKGVSAPGFSPPSLYKSNLISIDSECDSSYPSTVTDTLTGETSSVTDTRCGLLLFGGIGGKDLQSSLGKKNRLLLFVSKQP